jgi:hypothetical protein
MSRINDPFQPFLDFQREAFEPVRAATTVAAQAFERLARQNYALLGDYVEFAVEQAKLPAQAADVTDYVGRQMAASRAFGEKLARRAQEYAEIARSAQDATVTAAPRKAA